MAATTSPALALHAYTADPALSGAVNDAARWLSAAGISCSPDGGDAVLVVADGPLPSEVAARLAADPRPVLLAAGTLAHLRDGDLREATGVLPGATVPRHEMRVRPPRGVDLAPRQHGDLLVTETLRPAEPCADDVEVLLTANVALAERPVATWRPATGVGVVTLGGEPATWRDDTFRRMLLRVVRRMLGLSDRAPVRVGLLGYGAIGHEHNAAIQAVPGLELAAVCDRNPARVDAARSLAPAVRDDGDAEGLLADDGVDLVVVSTPPNTHAEWALRALRAGKHVVVEKPFAITVSEADAMVAEARERDLVLAVYQNRRWDADYLTVKRLVREGALGEVFHLETFIGGYGHPCNYWHSDEEVSGGAIYDWGSHYLDWVLDLLPQDVEHVTAATHKRVWHDVTNADHSRVTVRFVDGVEAEFVHSDLAAALKPKWYVLGTGGGLVGHWRRESVVGRTPIGLLDEDVLEPAESPARLELWAPDGSRTEVALSVPPPQPFHRELAELLLAGAPMSVTPAGSRRNLAVMQAAAESARRGGIPVPLP